jgi:hypothetical protein
MLTGLLKVRYSSELLQFKRFGSMFDLRKAINLQKQLENGKRLNLDAAVREATLRLLWLMSPIRSIRSSPRSMAMTWCMPQACQDRDPAGDV